MTRAAFTLVAALACVECGATKPAVVIPTPPPAASRIALLQKELSAIFEAPQFERSFWSVLVRPVGSVEDIFGLNAGKLMMPASAVKIVTTAAAAERLGWDHRFETRIVTAAPIESGILRGDLVIVGGGDPSISERSDRPGALRDMARQVREAGVTRIEGGVIGHDDLYDDSAFGEGWTLDNVPYGYAAPVSALTYNEGSIDLVIRAGAAAGDPVSVDMRPEGGELQIDNRLVTVAESGAGMLTLQRLPGSSRVTVQGQIPAKAAPFARTASVDNPTRFFAAAFRLALIAEGVQVDGDAIDIDELATKPDLTDTRMLVTRQSPPLSELAATMMRISQNQYAEMLLRSIGGRRTVQDILTGWGIPRDGYFQADGSGLSRYSYITSDALVRILQRMHSDPKHESAFSQSLPMAGRDGTLSKRLAGTAADGRVRAKTGTVNNTRAIAGYVQTADGETLVFSIIANNFNIANSAIDAAADSALIRLATFSNLVN
ncbi:MAG TPA: D-alanyl-D-alanine carboxypeptidase/D-alanyl-D-alanine-endopeptidase [Vicinamibacterales bacterium]|nr:D-alanyl-D-alanine carboxypeptidase/D-alanyl-D-alanine-endopeptidase [Vicinamibacterales bacterium]